LARGAGTCNGAGPSAAEGAQEGIQGNVVNTFSEVEVPGFGGGNCLAGNAAEGF
jgi:hypothetical protein